MGFFWRNVKANGFWTTLKMIDSKEFQAELYEAARECYIQTAYIIVLERFGDSAEVRRAMDEIHEYEDDPSYLQQSQENWDDINRRLKTLATLLVKAKDEDPEIRARNTLETIMTRYGFSEDQKKDVLIVAQDHSALEISDRWAKLWDENFVALRKQKGDLVLAYLVTYESRVEQNQARCRIAKQLQGEGLIDWDSLFPDGGNHATVRRDVEAFDRFLYSEWERKLVLKDTDKEERKREYRRFLRDRERNWGRQYLEWLGQGKDENKVKVDM